VSTSVRAGYHHGDLRATLLTTAMQMLERGEPFSLPRIHRGASRRRPGTQPGARPDLSGATVTDRQSVVVIEARPTTPQQRVCGTS